MRRILALLGLCTVAALAGAQPTLADGAPVLSLPGTVTVDIDNATSGSATFSVSAVDGLGTPIPVSCDHSSGDSFPLGTTTVNCSATDSSSVTTTGSFGVVVQDTTFPTLSLPAPPTVTVNGAAAATVTFSASASDAGTSFPVTCVPASGFSFPLGTTNVSCSATDAAGNTSTGGFDVSVQDTTPPTLTLPAPISASVNAASSATVTFSASATDGATPLTPSCTPASGSSFPLGTTSVSCSVADAAGNPASGSFTVTVVDTTPPTVSITAAPAGTVNVRDGGISFTTSEGTTTCQLDGGGFSACSSPAPFTGLADGSHTFTVRAVDAAANASTATATWTIDATPPIVSVPGSAIHIEANGPKGGTTTYGASATDNGVPLPPSAITCSPRSGSRFELGTSTVTCSATDAAGNTGRASFEVIVRDTTPPAINAPDVSVTATGADGIHKTDPALASYLAQVSASDLVSTPTLTNTVPDQLPIGPTTVTFTAEDAAGNVATKKVVITVLAVGKTAPPVDLKPPANPTGIVAKAGDGRIDLAWKPDADAAYVSVTLSVVGKSSAGKEVCRVTVASCAIKGLENGTAYRLVLTAWDTTRNRSKGVIVTATPQAEFLLSPRSSQRVVRAPLLRWTPVGRAPYFNVQLWRGKKKVLSAWPSVARLQLPGTWTFEGKQQKLEPGVYTWYVWPGIGPRAADRYGQLLGSSSFTVVLKLPPL